MMKWYIIGAILVIAFIGIMIAMQFTKKPSSGSSDIDYPLSAFQSGVKKGMMSQPQFLGDIMTLHSGEEFSFKTDSINGTVSKGYADKWKLEIFRENNERQSIHYDTWSDLAYKLDQYMIGARYFIVNMQGVEFHVGEVKQGPVKQLMSGNDEFQDSDLY